MPAFTGSNGLRLRYLLDLIRLTTMAPHIAIKGAKRKWRIQENTGDIVTTRRRSGARREHEVNSILLNMKVEGHTDVCSAD